MPGQLLRLSIVALIGIVIGFFARFAHAADTVESLAADRQRLREVENLCRNDWAGTGDTLCVMASKARRRRFLGSGQTPYTPHPVDLFPSLDEKGTPKPAAPPRPAAE